MLPGGRENSLSPTVLLLGYSFLITFSELSGSFGDILSQSEASLLLSPFSTVDLNFPLGNHAIILSDGPIAACAFALQEIKHFFGVTLPASLAKSTQVDCAVLRVETELVKTSVE